jgi:c(7)-type cytochrome triheme protein
VTVPATVLLVAALVAGFASVAPAAPAARPPSSAATAPADLDIPKAESSPGQVRFSHRTHLTGGLHCSTCHMRDMKMKRGESKITLEGKQAGKFCGACHDGKTRVGARPVFPIDDCDRCHKD